MSKIRVYIKIPVLLLSVFIVSLLLVWSISAEEPPKPEPIKQRFAEKSKYEFAEPKPEVIGVPCGSGELMDPDTICLHGRVLFDSSNGNNREALANIQVDVTFGDETLTAYTFIHAGDGEPTYGVDISPLEPNFLEPVTVTAHVSGTLITRQVTVFPNFDTHNQLYDVIVPNITAFDNQIIWGHVIDYTAGGPVAGAKVTATYGSPSQQVVRLTEDTQDESYPTYSFDAGDLPGVSLGDEVTLTAEFEGEAITQIVTISDDEPIQQNLLTGWKCNDYDPFPRENGLGGFPRENGLGGFPGFPDAICVWGYGLSNGVPTETIKIEIEIDGQYYQGTTKRFPGEELPRFGIALPNGDELINKPMTVTAVYRGLAEQVQTVLSPKDSPIQRVDLNIIGVGILGNAVNGNGIADYVWLDGHLWVATNGGVVRWDPDDLSSYKLLTPNNSDLTNFAVPKIQKDGLGNLYFQTLAGNWQQYKPSTDEWETIDPANQQAEGPISITDPDQVWVSSYQQVGQNNKVFNGLYRLDPNSGLWESHLLEDHPDSISTVVQHQTDLDGDSWFITTDDQLLHFSNAQQTWELIAEDPNFPIGNLIDIEIGPDGLIWLINYNVGLLTYNPQTKTWGNYQTSNSNLHTDENFDLGITESGEMYILSSDMIQTFNQTSGVWRSWFNPNSAFLEPNTGGILKMFVSPSGDVFTTAPRSTQGLVYWRSESDYSHLLINDQGPIGSTIYKIVEEIDGRVWFATDQGISAYDPISGLWDSFTSANSTLPNNAVRSLTMTPDGALWAIYQQGGTFNVWNYNTLNGNSIPLHPSLNNPTGGSARNVNWNQLCECVVIGSTQNLLLYFPSEAEWEEWEIDAYPTTNSTIATLMSDNKIWIADEASINGAGIRILDRSNSTIVDLSDKPEWAFAEDYYTTSFVESGDGAIWIALENIDDGTTLLVEYKADQILNKYSGNDFALPPSLYDMSVDKHNRIWLLNRETVAMFDPFDGSVQSFEPAFSLVGEDIGLDKLAFSFGRSNDLWIATVNGVSHWFVPVQEADLELTLSGPEESLISENQFSYTLDVANKGEIATKAELLLQNPVGTSFVNSNFPQLLNVGSSYSIDLGILAAGESRSYTFELQSSLNWEAGQHHDVSVQIDGGSRESITSNNEATVSTRFVLPDQVDLSISLSAPPSIGPGNSLDLLLIIANQGQKSSDATMLDLQLPEGLTIEGSNPQNGNSWAIPQLAAGETFQIDVPLVADNNLTQDIASIEAKIPLQQDESRFGNNQVKIELPISASAVRTLILVAPERLNRQYAPSTILNDVYQLASHSAVDGLVINIENDPTIASTFEFWDDDPADWTRANQVAESIQTLLNRYLDQYSTVEYVILVGGDQVLPHYRVNDNNKTQWQERNYAIQVEGHSALYAAMLANKLLTDDFYVDRTPVVPDSFFWPNDDVVYLPDYSIGRLVETPEEISAVINLFIENNGLVAIDNAVIGGDEFLAGDLVDQQCRLITQRGMIANCANSDLSFAHAFNNGQPSSTWTAFHSNHYSMGVFGEALDAQSLYQSNVGDTFMGTIGCHAGLNVADANLISDVDLAQGIAFNGGTTIGSTAYTYGSSWDVNYTEALMADFMQRFLSVDGESVGPILKDAKQAYFAQRAWFDPLDAKTLQPMIFYGLPMLRYDIPDNQLRKAVEEDQSLLKFSDSHDQIVTMNFSNSDFEKVITDDGEYYEFRGQTLAQYKQPIQPAHSEVILSKKDGQVLKGVLILSAKYDDFPNFDPVINESWAMGAQTQQELVEPILEMPYWDRDLPVALTILNEGSTNNALLNYVPGMFNADLSTERLFSSITVEMVYGDAADKRPPELTFATLDRHNGQTKFIVGASDQESSIARIVVSYEANGEWHSIELSHEATQDIWIGSASSEVFRYRLQAVDEAGNVGDLGWLEDGFEYVEILTELYLPLVTR